jgi:hypothetical protein
MADDLLLFKELTGCADEKEARHLMDACQNDVQEAVDLYFASFSGRPSNLESAVSSSLTQQLSVHDDKENNETLVKSVPTERPSGTAHSGLEDITQNSSSSVASTSSTRTLAALFRAPIDLMFKGGWEKILAEGCRLQKWLLINLQEEQSFPCQVLNRDVWANDSVKKLVKNCFIFWQLYSTSDEGKSVVSRFGADHYPLVFIVDPRSGKKIRDILILPPSETMNLADPALPVIEEIRAFLRSNWSFDKRDELVEKANAGSAVATRETALETPAKPAEVDPEQWRQHVGQKDDSTADVSLAVVFPDGKREHLVLTDTSSIKVLFIFIAGRGYAPSDHVLFYGYPPKKLTDNDNSTFRELGAVKEVVHVKSK